MRADAYAVSLVSLAVAAHRDGDVVRMVALCDALALYASPDPNFTGQAIPQPVNDAVYAVVRDLAARQAFGRAVSTQRVLDAAADAWSVLTNTPNTM